METKKMTRREFVRVGGSAVGALALTGTGLVAGCGSNRKYPEIPMTDERLVIDLSDHPSLREQGNGILFQVPNNHENIVIVHTKDGFVATGAQCPHQGCSVRWKKKEELLVCPCHKSSYSADGTCVRGPGRKNPPACETWGKRLTPYNAALEGDTIVVTAIDE